MSDERTKAELRAENQRLRERLLDLQEYVPQVGVHPTRRDVMAAIAGGIGLHFALGSAKGQTLGSGEIASQSNPALRVYVNRVHFVDIGSDPSSPEDGSMYYNSNA